MNEAFNRLDLFLVKNKLSPSRNNAKELIVNGKVFVNGKPINKQSYLLKSNDEVKIINNDKFVSRGAYKLLKAINYFIINLSNNVVLDIGASTGGFTDVCLRNNAKKVYALDVGTNQLNEKLKNNKLVISIENTNLKDISLKLFKETIDWIVCDVSFISLKFVFNMIKEVFNYKINMICLIKPQFELDKKTLDKYHGKINNDKLWKQAINNVKNYANDCNFKIMGIVESPILGAKKQNKEFLMWVKN